MKLKKLLITGTGMVLAFSVVFSSDADAKGRSSSSSSYKSSYKSNVKSTVKSTTKAIKNSKKKIDVDNDFDNCAELREVYPKGVSSKHEAYELKLDRNKNNWACE